MHRLQIALPEWQRQYLANRARRDGVSMAEVVRQLVRREAESPKPSVRAREALMNLAGLGRDENPLIDDIPVSERPELYTISPSPSDDE